MSILGNATKPEIAAPVRMWLYGAPNTGKTHFATQFPKPILLSTDGNYVYEKVPANSLAYWESGLLAKNEQKEKSFINVLNELKESTQFDTIILDLVDGAYRLARNHYLGILKIQHEGDLSYGKGYTIIRENFISAIEQLFKLPVNIIIISHEDKDKIEPKNAAPYTVFKPALDAKFHEVFEGYCNLVARMFIDIDDEGNRVRKLSLNPKEHEYGINRLGDCEDFIVAHNGDNYGDFIKIWADLYAGRGLGQLSSDAVDKTRLQAEKDRLEGEKAKETEALTRAAAKAKELKTTKEKKVVEKTVKPERETDVEEPKQEVVEEVKQEPKQEVVEETAAQKIARMKALSKGKVVEVKKEVVVEVAAEPVTEPIEDTQDDEPEIVRTASTDAKLKRIAELKKQKLAQDNKE